MRVLGILSIATGALFAIGTSGNPDPLLSIAVPLGLTISGVVSLVIGLVEGVS